MTSIPTYPTLCDYNVKFVGMKILHNHAQETLLDMEVTGVNHVAPAGDTLSFYDKDDLLITFIANVMHCVRVPRPEDSNAEIS